ncbi:hypothetical protein U9M48_011345 [Paspalum notatum var. saurae]|uniref:3'-5' exonuclease domain-containing protein n=1 Tax=Paspalum notatum var. saurae TaxID=547442 RepID=A0AAQ3WH98_PASNO
MDDAAVSTRLRRSTPSHDAYTVRVFDDRFASLATVCPADARRWVATTRWRHGGLLRRGRLVVGLGVQWTPSYQPLHGEPPVPDTLQLCVGHRCLVYHLARADAVPEGLRRFLADPRVTFVGSGAANDARMLSAHRGLHVRHGVELRSVAGTGNASVEDMAHRFLGYPGIHKPKEVATSAWHAPRLSQDQVQYAAVDAYLAFRLGVHLLSPTAGAAAPPPAVRGFSGLPASAGADAYGSAVMPVHQATYASDSEYGGDDYSDWYTEDDLQEYEEWYTDEEDDQMDEEGYNVDYQGAGEWYTAEDLEGEEYYNDEDQMDEEGYNVDHQEDGQGIITDDNYMDWSEEFTGGGAATCNHEEEYNDSYPEYLGHSEAVLDDGGDALAQDDWYNQEVEWLTMSVINTTGLSSAIRRSTMGMVKTTRLGTKSSTCRDL